MKIFFKSVALVLGILLWAMPILAAVPCTAGNCAMDCCAACCGHMGGEQMAASEATLSSPSLLLYSTPMEPASSTCNCTAASDGATSALPPVSHSILPSTSGTAMADVIPDLRPHAPEGCGSPSPAAVRPVAQSLLCTFLI